MAIDALDLLGSNSTSASTLQNNHYLEFLIADFRDAFFLLPNMRSERRYFVVWFNGQYIVFVRTVQGTRIAPLTWGRLAALLTRLTQAVLGCDARMSTYVDDPITVSVGTHATHRRRFATVILLWSALRIPLSLEKAKISRTPEWTSAAYSSTPSSVTVSIKGAILDDVKALTQQFLSSNVVSLKDLESYIGKAMHIAGVIPVVRPFLTDLYAALHSKAPTHGSPSGCIWVKQIRHVLWWLRALLNEDFAKLTRRFSLQVHVGRGQTVEFHFDGCPWGMGGFLTVDHAIVSWFTAALTKHDCDSLGVEIGSSSSQQVIEALAILIALRLWRQYWCANGVVLRIRSDSVSALTMALKLKASGRATSIVAREIALQAAMANYFPIIAEHVPGIANCIPDVLSRRHQPSKEVWSLPAELQHIPETTVAQIVYTTLQAPAAL